MYDKGKITLAILIFLALATLPLWVGRGAKATLAPISLDTPEIRGLASKECVEPAPYMRSSHMELLKSWRDAVVRDGNDLYVNHEGRKYPISLSQTCLGCHSNKENFCDTCHASSGVKPGCWSCHSAPKKGAQ
jgi:hypothetical protein